MTAGFIFALLVGLGWVANLAAVVLRWCVAVAYPRPAPSRRVCPCGYPRTGLARGAACPECARPAPAFTTGELVARPSSVPPSSGAGWIAPVTIVVVCGAYALGLVWIGVVWGTVSPPEMLLVSVLLAPAALLAGAHVLFPNVGRRRLSARRTAVVGASVGAGTLIAALVYAWYDAAAASVSTTSEWPGIGLIVAAIPGVAGAGFGVALVTTALIIADRRGRKGRYPHVAPCERSTHTRPPARRSARGAGLSSPDP